MCPLLSIFFLHVATAVGWGETPMRPFVRADSAGLSSDVMGFCYYTAINFFFYGVVPHPLPPPKKTKQTRKEFRRQANSASSYRKKKQLIFPLPWHNLLRVSLKEKSELLIHLQKRE